MSVINEPNYKHYSRLNTIYAYEAQKLLSSFELHDKNITDPGEYNKLFNEEMVLAYTVLHSAFDNNNLKFTSEGNPYADNGDEKYYILDVMMLNFAEFCTWASKKKYKLPDELAVLSMLPSSEIVDKDQDKEGDNETKIDPNGKKTVAPATDNTKTVDGLLKMVIAMAMDCYGYDPADKKSTVTADIQKALEKCNLTLSDNTIRTRLKEAAEIVERK